VKKEAKGGNWVRNNGVTAQKESWGSGLLLWRAAPIIGRKLNISELVQNAKSVVNQNMERRHETSSVKEEAKSGNAGNEGGEPGSLGASPHKRGGRTPPFIDSCGSVMEHTGTSHAAKGGGIEGWGRGETKL
jgi:hypothetical protein